MTSITLNPHALQDKEVDRCLCLNSLALSDIVLSDIPDGVNETGAMRTCFLNAQRG